jgi:hypothetical protein
MYTENHSDLRKIINFHLGPNAGDASKEVFEKAKLELIFTKTARSKAINLITMENYLKIVGQKPEELALGVNDAAAIVESYFIPLPSESINGAFSRAKREAISKLKSEIVQLKSFSFKDYSVQKKKKVSAKKMRTTNFDNVRVEKKRKA